MSYLIVAVIFALIGFAGCFLIYRNNFTKIGRIMEVLDKGVFDANTAKAIEAIIKDDCVDCK
jgi:multisubunit Na+/H+ antiporter MnhC subunit